MVIWDFSPIKQAFLILFCLNIIFGQSEFYESMDPENSIPESDLIILEHAQIFYDSLSTKSAKLLSQLSFLSDSDVSALLVYRPGVDSTLNVSNQLNQLLQSIWIEKYAMKKQGLVSFKMNLVDDIQYRWKMEHHFKSSQIGIMGERDGSEPTAMDYASLYYKTNLMDADITVGHFQFISGHGLVSWRTMPLKSDFGVSNAVMRMGKGIQPYRSGHESWAYRGIGLNKRIGKYNVSSAISSRHLDGVLHENGISISNTGLHVSASQIENKNNISEFILLNQIEYPLQNGTIGAIVGAGRWVEKPNSISNTIGSLFGRYKKGIITVSGESSLNYFGKKGLVVSSSLKHDNFQYGLSYRHIDPTYIGLRDNMIRNWNSIDLGEWGILQEVRFRFSPALITIYSDNFSRIENEVGQFIDQGFESGINLQIKHNSAIHSTLQTKWQGNTISDYNYHIETAELETSIKTKVGIKWKRTPNNTIQAQFQKRTHTENLDVSYGLQLRNQYNYSNWKSNLFWMSTIVENNQWLYFWDVTLPGEMRSKVFTTSGHYAGISIRYRTSEFSELHFRVSSHWKHTLFQSIPIFRGALQINLMI